MQRRVKSEGVPLLFRPIAIPRFPVPVARHFLRDCFICATVRFRTSSEGRISDGHTVCLRLFQVHGEGSVPEKILKAEDDYIALQSLGQFLTEEGYQIERASTGLEALKLLENDRFDLVISDISMPELDGFNGTGIVRAAGGRF